MVKIFSMVKNESDIVKDWVLYHSQLVGIQNIYVLDNMSTDATFNILTAMKVNCSRVADYRMKGEYTTSFLKSHKNELIIPLDMDEFLVLYDPATKTISTEKISETLARLPVRPVYKMPYIHTHCSKEYVRATFECETGSYGDYGNCAKSFFHTKAFHGKVDHGNHFYSNDYYKSPFALVHYHQRNLAQITTKTKDNLLGLGYDLNNKKELERSCAEHGMGNHHASNWLKMMDGAYTFSLSTGDISLAPLSNKLKTLSTLPNVVGVVARYNESLEWMLEPPFNLIKYIVYNKGVNDDFCKMNVVSVVKLPNVGRCDHTFLHYICSHYGNLPNVVLFLPGSIDIPFKKEKASIIVRRALAHSKPAFVVNEWCDVRKKFNDFTLDEWTCIHPSNNALNNEAALTPSPFRPFGKWYDAHFGKFNASFYGIHGIFSVSRQMVQRRVLSEYTSLLRETAQSSNVEVGHFLERAWGAVFMMTKNDDLF